MADVPPDPNSGAAGTVWHTNVALRKLGHEVDEIWADQLGPRRIRHGNLHSLLEQPRAYRREVLKAVAQKDYDVVLMSQPQAHLAAKALKKSGFGGVVINRSHGVELRVNEVLPEWHRQLGVPESRFPQSLLTPALRKLLERQWTEVARWSDGIIVPCEDDRQCLLRRLKVLPDRVRTIHHGVPDEYLEDEPPPMTKERMQRLLYVGQFAFIKGPYILADVLNRVLETHRECIATWITSASESSRVTELLHPGVRSRVSIQPWVGQRELRDVYDEHGVFLFPSLFEGAGKACLEAMSRGLCVVASDTGGMRDYITPNHSGHLVAVGEVPAWTHTVGRVLSDHGHFTHEAMNARAVAQGLTWECCASRISTFESELYDAGPAYRTSRLRYGSLTSSTTSPPSAVDHSCNVAAHYRGSAR